MTLIPVKTKNLNKSDHGPGSIRKGGHIAKRARIEFWRVRMPTGRRHCDGPVAPCGDRIARTVSISREIASIF